MDKTKFISLAVCLAYFICPHVFFSPGNGSVETFIKLVYLSPALILIWFGEELGSLTGYTWRTIIISKESPGFLIRFFGWGVLLLPAAVSLIKWIAK